MKGLFKHLIIVAMVLFAGSICASAQQYSDIFEYIRGRVPGVQVGQAGPGEMPRIIIRGVGTNSDQTQPLFIVDGLQVESIANGVIMVTTKSAVHAQEAEAAAKKAAKQAKREARKKKNAE